MKYKCDTFFSSNRPSEQSSSGVDNVLSPKGILGAGLSLAGGDLSALGVDFKLPVPFAGTGIGVVKNLVIPGISKIPFKNIPFKQIGNFAKGAWNSGKKFFGNAGKGVANTGKKVVNKVGNFFKG